MRLNTRLADSLNVMYQGVVNDHIVAPINTKEYAEASEFVESFYSKLNESVMEYLAAYMCVYPEGKIQFMPAKKSGVELACRHNDYLKVVGYNDEGVIVKDEEARIVQKGE